MNATETMMPELRLRQADAIRPCIVTDSRELVEGVNRLLAAAGDCAQADA